MKRENWMLELPPEQAADFGLGPRQFRFRTKPELGDRTVWTDTPVDRLQKELSPVSLSVFQIIFLVTQNVTYFSVMF